MIPSSTQPRTTLGRIQLGLQLECVLVKVLLQLLVREVDTELLERVRLEDLKPEYIQDPDRVSAAAGLLNCRDRLVHSKDDPAHLDIEGHYHGRFNIEGGSKGGRGRGMG